MTTRGYFILLQNKEMTMDPFEIWKGLYTPEEINQSLKGSNQYKKTVWDILFGTAAATGSEKVDKYRDDLRITDPSNSKFIIAVDPSYGSVAHDVQLGNLNLNTPWDFVSANYQNRDWRAPVNLPQIPKEIPKTTQPIPVHQGPPMIEDNNNNNNSSQSDFTYFFILGGIGLGLFLILK